MPHLAHTYTFRSLLTVVAFSLAGLALTAGTGCSTNPTTGRSQLNLLSRQQEIQMGEEAQPQLTSQYGGEVANANLKAYVTRIGEQMAEITEADNPSLPWEFTLLDSDVINAFALPGGKVFVSRGLAARMDNEAQLAAVLGHEIGHVTARHINERISRQLALTGIVVGATAAVSGSDDDLIKYGVPVAVSTAGGGYLLSFSRSQELEADKLGMRYMTKVGYNPRGALQMMQVLQSASEGPRPLEWLSTHPHPETRIDQIQELLDSKYASVGGELYEARYQNQFLSLLPEPTEKEGAGIDPAKQTMAWCSVCAHAQQDHESAADTAD